ncbi:MAG: glycosyl hydrolase family 28 protein, partial [Candidatus Limisoma sp.]
QNCYCDMWLSGQSVSGAPPPPPPPPVVNCVYSGTISSTSTIAAEVVNGTLTNQTATPTFVSANTKEIKVSCTEDTEQIIVHRSYEGGQDIHFFKEGKQWTGCWVGDFSGDVYAIVKAPGKLPSKRIKATMATVSKNPTWSYSTAYVNGESYSDGKVLTHGIPSGYSYLADATRQFNVAVNGHYAPTYSDINFWNRPVNFSMLEFEDGQEVHIEVARDQDFTSFRILPHDSQIYDVKRFGNCISFKTRKADQKLSIVYDDDYFGGFLHLFASSIDHSDPKLATSGYVYDSATKTHYFAKGYHNLYSSYTDGFLQIKEDQKIYIASGAVLNGIVGVVGGNGAKIYGRGLIATNAKKILLGVDWSGGRVDVEGVTIHPHREQCWSVCVSNCTNTHFKNVNIVATRCPSSDGLDIGNTSNSTFENMFIHSGDDAIAIKGAQSGDPAQTMPNKNLRFRYIQTWNDCNNGLGLGAETNCYYSDIRFDDCYVLFNYDDGWNHNKLSERGAMNICSLNSTYFDNITFEDIYVYRTERLIGMCFIDDFYFGSIKGDMSGAGAITNIKFKNIFSPYRADSSVANNMNYAAWTSSPVKPIHDILFWNLAIEGNQILDYTTGYNTYTSQVWNLFYAGEQMPWINTSTGSVSMSTEAPKKVTSQVKITGGDLYGNISLKLEGADAGLFSIDRTTIERKAGETAVTITYAPTAEGTHTANLVVSAPDMAAKTITINGTASAPAALDDNVLTMAEMWNYSANTTLADWMDFSAKPVRSIANLGDRLYVLQTTNYSAPEVVILNAYDGTQIGTLPVDGISGGAYYLSSLMAFDGKLIGTNACDASHTFKVYCWDSDTTAPTVLVQDATHDSEKMGAQVNAYGTWADGKILVTNNGTSKVFVYTISNGTISSTPTVINLKDSDGNAFAGGDGRGSAGIIMNADGTFWLDGYSQLPTLFSADGVAQKTMNAAVLGNNNGGTSMALINYGTRKYLAATSYLSSNINGGFVLADVTDGIAEATANRFFYPSAGLGPAGNAQRISTVVGKATDDYKFHVWVSVQGQGVAYYCYDGARTNAVQMFDNDAVQLVYAGGVISVEGADSAVLTVYNTAGSIVASTASTSMSTTALLPGVYIVKAVADKGNVVTKKIVVK